MDHPSLVHVCNSQSCSTLDDCFLCSDLSKSLNNQWDGFVQSPHHPQSCELHCYLLLWQWIRNQRNSYKDMYCQWVDWNNSFLFRFVDWLILTVILSWIPFLTVICPDLPALDNAVIVYNPTSTPRLQGAMATHSCVTGYTLSSSTTTRTCQSDRMWSEPSLTCQSELYWPSKVVINYDNAYFQLWTVAILRWSRMECAKFLLLHLERWPFTRVLGASLYQETPLWLVWSVDPGAHLQYALVSNSF